MNSEVCIRGRTEAINFCRWISKFVKKGFGEKEVEAVLQRLDRLTQDEARTTAAQSLEVVYGLVQNMSVVMDGEQNTLALKSGVH